MGNILDIYGLNKSYSGIKVLKDIEFHLKKGEVHGLVGENGAGKSTLIKIIAGVEQPDKGGQILFEGTQAERLTPIKSIKLGISVLYQDISLFPNLSIAENICIGSLKGPFVNWKRIHETSARALERVGAEDIDPYNNLGDVSIGKQQIVALARAVLQKSKIIIMDEPSAALSSSEVRMLYQTIRMLKKRNVSLIYISHKLDEVLTVSDRISVLRDGKMIATRSAGKFDNQSIISMMVGRKLRFLPMRNEGNTGNEILGVKGLTKEPFFRDISFSLYKNEILGITGLVGAKRSEMAQTLFGLLKADRGSIILDEEAVKIGSTADAIKRGICYLPEDRREQGLFLGKSMSENITVSSINKILNRFRLISKRQERSLTGHYIDRLNIRPNNPGIRAENMSGGNQQKALFGRWLNAGPRVFIADEPTSGVDVGSKLEIHRLLRELAQSGVGIVLVSSDLSEVLAVSDRIIIMRGGRIVDEMHAGNATQEDIITKGLMG